jgi:hypothetical protein
MILAPFSHKKTLLSLKYNQTFILDIVISRHYKEKRTFFRIQKDVFSLLLLSVTFLFSCFDRRV